MSKMSGTASRRPTPAGKARLALVLLCCSAATAACGGSLALSRALLREARPVGVGPRFQPGVSGRVIGRCERAIGDRYGAHVEVFAQNKVVVIPAGIGTLAPRTLQDGQVVRARCYGALVTLAPTGVVLIRDGAKPRLGQLFEAWGETLSASRLASFGGGPVRVFVDGRRWRGSPSALRLRRHAEIVLEVGPRVPPHHSFLFPPGE
jgi:hypothetical protein